MLYDLHVGDMVVKCSGDRDGGGEVMVEEIAGVGEVVEGVALARGGGGHGGDMMGGRQ